MELHRMRELPILMNGAMVRDTAAGCNRLSE
jgi:hypothetical protein